MQVSYSHLQRNVGRPFPTPVVSIAAATGAGRARGTDDVLQGGLPAASGFYTLALPSHHLLFRWGCSQVGEIQSSHHTNEWERVKTRRWKWTGIFVL